MFTPKVKLNKEIYDKACSIAKSLGVTVEEFIERVLVLEIERIEIGNEEVSGEEEAKAANQLKGLGYLE